MMKKYLPVLLSAGLLTMALSGCSDTLPNDNPQEETASVTEQEETMPVMPATEQETTGSELPETAEVSNTENEISATDTEEQDTQVSYYGTWEVRDYQSAEVSALSSDEMEAFRGTTITYQPDSVLLDGEKVTDDNFTYETDGTAYDYDSLTEAYQANLGEWWNEISEVTYVTVDSSEDFFGNQFFTADADTIWIYYEGVFFLAKNVGR